MSFSEALNAVLYRLLLSVMVPSGVIVLCLYILHWFGAIKYLPASALAFGVGFYVLFLIFKYWIKPDSGQIGSKNLRYFLIVFIVNLAINTEIVYLLVTYVGVPLLTAQMVAAVVVAYESYYAYQSLLFYKKPVVIQRPKNLQDEIVFYDEQGHQL